MLNFWSNFFFRTHLSDNLPVSGSQEHSYFGKRVRGSLHQRFTETLIDHMSSLSDRLNFMEGFLSRLYYGYKWMLSLHFSAIQWGQMSSSEEWKDKPVKYLRDQVVDQLKYNLANDHLEIDEFEQLVRMALSTQSQSELLSLTTDLPSKDKTEKQNLEQELAAYRDSESMISILSESKRKGMWLSPK